MDEMNACPCCLRCPPDKDLTTPYTQLDKTKIYSDMLKDCFNIQPVLDEWSSRGICCTCAGRLRDASDFKLQVQRCQAELLARSHSSRVKVQLAEDEDEIAYECMLKRLLLVSEIAVRDGASDAGQAMLQEPVVKSEMEDGGSSDEIVLHEEISIKPEVIGADEACADDRQEMSLVISRCAGAESAASSRAVRPERELRRTASEEEPYGCDMCPLRFSAKSTLTRHIGTHYQCELCNMTFMMSTCLIRHKRHCTENERYKCDTLLSEPSTLQINHGGQLLYSCDECSKDFRIKSALREHIQRSHTVIGLNRTSGSCSGSGKHPNNKFRILELQSDQRIHTGEKPFKCRYCDYNSNHKSHLKRHQMIHTGEKPHECCYCDYKCSHKSDLKKHQMIHTGEKPHECRYCDYKCSQKSYLKKHQMIHTGEMPFKCQLCDYKCRRKVDLRTHQMIHTGENAAFRELRRTASEEEPYGCDMCPLRFSAKSTLTRHIGTHYQCQLCNMTFMMSTCLIRHKRHCTENERYKCDTLLSEPSTLQINHGGQLLYSCDECGKDFRIKSALREHIQRSHTVIGLNRTSGSCSGSGKHPNNKFRILELQSDQRIHTGEKPFKCRYCDYNSNHKSHLKRHQMIHTGEKPHECRYCDYKCSHKSDLKKHQMIHTGEKPHECRYCDYKCSQKSYLKKHQMIHTGEMPFKCQLCDYKCRRKVYLRTHQMIHTGEKPHECRYCDYKCSQKSKLQSHQMIHTGEKPHECRYCDYKCGKKSNLKRHQMIHTGKKS